MNKDIKLFETFFNIKKSVCVASKCFLSLFSSSGLLFDSANNYDITFWVLAALSGTIVVGFVFERVAKICLKSDNAKY